METVIYLNSRWGQIFNVKKLFLTLLVLAVLVYFRNNHVNTFWTLQQVTPLEELFCIWNISALTLARVHSYACLKEKKSLMLMETRPEAEKTGLLSNDTHFFSSPSNTKSFLQRIIFYFFGLKSKVKPQQQEMHEMSGTAASRLRGCQSNWLFHQVQLTMMKQTNNHDLFSQNKRCAMAIYLIPDTKTAVLLAKTSLNAPR